MFASNQSRSFRTGGKPSSIPRIPGMPRRQSWVQCRLPTARPTSTLYMFCRLLSFLVRNLRTTSQVEPADGDQTRQITILHEKEHNGCSIFWHKAIEGFPRRRVNACSIPRVPGVLQQRAATTGSASNAGASLLQSNLLLSRHDDRGIK